MNFRLNNLNPINVALTCLHDESVEYIDERIVVLNNINIGDRGNYRIEIEHDQDNALLSINKIELINHNNDPRLRVDYDPELRVNNRFTLSLLPPSQVTMTIRVKFTIHKPLYGNNIEFRYKLVRDGSNLPIGNSISIVNVNSVYNSDNDRCKSCKKYYDALINIIRPNVNGIVVSDVDPNYNVVTINPVAIPENHDFPAVPGLNATIIIKRRYSEDRTIIIKRENVNLINNNIHNISIGKDDLNNDYNTPLTVEVNVPDFLCYDSDIIRLDDVGVRSDINELKVEWQYEDGTSEELNAFNCKLKDFQMPMGGAKITHYIYFKNKATLCPSGLVGNYGVILRNIKTEFISSEREKIRVLGFSDFVIQDEEGNNIVDKERIPWNFSSDNVILLEAGNVYSIGIVLDSNVLQKIELSNNTRHIEWKLQLSYEYLACTYENDNVLGGYKLTPYDDTDFIPIVNNIETRLFEQEPNILHSVDFGTSAVVACWQDAGANTHLMNLRQNKETLIDLINTKEDDERFEPELVSSIDYSELAPRIISSEVMVDNNPNQEILITSKGREYYSSQVLFSPTSEWGSIANRLPCLKNLVGHRTTPRINGRAINMNVNDLLGIVYKQLCQFFIVDNEHPIESLTITIPNTFTHLHINQLKDIVLDRIPTLAKVGYNNNEYVSFVSESDSVLCEYIRNKNRISGTHRVNNGYEYVLIYDMGAGTLDITYAKCDFVQGIPVGIKILGRAGSCLAGNYIDHLLGDILYDILRERNIDDGKLDAFRRALDLTGVDYDSLKRLKDYLRNRLKPCLNNINDTLPKPIKHTDNGDVEDDTYNLVGNHEYTELGEVKIEDVINNKKFRDFVESCTEDIIGNLANVYGVNRDGRISIDTVVVSGRTIEIKSIRECLRGAICEHKNNPAIQATFVRIDGVDFDANVGDTVSLKTVVANGALVYNRMKNNISQDKLMFGHYGLICTIATTGDRVLLGFNPEQANGNGILVGCYNGVCGYSNNGTFETNGDTIRVMTGEVVIDNLIHDMQLYSQIELYHSYYSIEKVYEEIQNLNGASGNRDTNKIDCITILKGEPTAGYGNNINVSLKVNASGELEYEINHARIELSLADNYSNESLRRSLWPIKIN